MRLGMSGDRMGTWVWTMWVKMRGESVVEGGVGEETIILIPLVWLRESREQAELGGDYRIPIPIHLPIIIAFRP